MRKVESKVITSKISAWYRPKDNIFVFMEQKMYPSIYVKTLNNDKYKIVSFVKKAKYMQNIKKDVYGFTEYIQEHHDDMFNFYKDRAWSRNFEDEWFDEKRYKKLIMDMHFKRVQLLCYKGFVDDLVDGSENRFFNDNAVLKDGIIDKSELYKILVQKNGLSHHVFVDSFGEVDLSSSGTGFNKVKFGKWTLLIDEDVKAPVEDIEKLLSDTQATLRKMGMGHLVGGRVAVHKNLRSSGHNTLADYSLKDGHIRLKVKGKSIEKGHLNSMIHELGHKNYYEFFNDSQRKEVLKKYNEMFSKSSNRTLPSGEKFEYQDNIFEVITPMMNKVSVKIDKVVNKDSLKDISKKLRSLKNVSDEEFEEVAKLMRLDFPSYVVKSKEVTPLNPEYVRSNITREFIVTTYASTNESEMYAEMFAEDGLRGLKSNAKFWFDKLETV